MDARYRSGPAGRRAAATTLSHAAAPLNSITLNRDPAPPNCVQPGGTESFNWTIQFNSVPDHYVYSITNPLDNVVYGPFTVNVQGQPSPVSGSDEWPVPVNALPGNYAISIWYYSNVGLEATARVIFVVCGAPTSTPTPTLTPCPIVDGIQNGGFETGSLAPWVVQDTNPAPVVSAAQAHSGTYSVLLGTTSGPEPLGDGSLYQGFTVLAGATLSFWYYPGTIDSIAFDWQDAYLTDSNGIVLARILHVLAKMIVPGSMSPSTWPPMPASRCALSSWSTRTASATTLTSMLMMSSCYPRFAARSRRRTRRRRPRTLRPQYHPRSRKSPVPPTLTTTAVPPTLTQTPVPPTLTPTAVPPTLTRTAVPPTLTATAVPPRSRKLRSRPRSRGQPFRRR